MERLTWAGSREEVGLGDAGASRPEAVSVPLSFPALKQMNSSGHPLGMSL